MPTENLETLVQFFKVLSNESRLKLVGILSQQECSVEELATLLNLKEPTVSHHLTRLKELHLVQMRPEGNTHLYQLNTAALHQLSQVMFTPDQMTALTHDIQEERWESKVLSNFLEGDRLKDIPASRKKRWVILKWLVHQFQPEATYSEAEVNTIIKRHHPDCATLRRELIGYQMMQRQNGIYQRLPEHDWKDE